MQWICVSLEDPASQWFIEKLENRSKRNQNRSKIDKHSIKIYKKSSKIRSWRAWGHLSSPDPFWDRFGHQLGFHLGSFLRPSGSHVGAMLAQKLILGCPGWPSKATMKFDTFLNRFGTDFASILGSKMEPKSIQDRSQERSWNKCKNIQKD